MLDSLLDAALVLAIVVAALIGLASWLWAIYDIVVSEAGGWKRGGHRRWAWAIAVLLVPFMALYYLFVIRPAVGGESFSPVVGRMTALLGMSLAAVAFLAIATYNDAVAGVLAIPTFFLMYLGLNAEEFASSTRPTITGIAGPAVTEPMEASASRLLSVP
jgi:hypothetical protein